MRIIAGSAKGAKLLPPHDSAIRPTLDRVREACFSIIAPRLEGARFLDLFAGTGANGLEALSRGALQADLVDASPAARKIIEANAARTRLGDYARIHAFSLPAGLPKLAKYGPYHLIYADPPHTFTDYVGLFDAIAQAQLLAPHGLAILEHGPKSPVAESYGPFDRVRRADYGRTSLSVFLTRPPRNP